MLKIRRLRNYEPKREGIRVPCLRAKCEAA
jgi:hypothetical protein